MTLLSETSSARRIVAEAKMIGATGGTTVVVEGRGDCRFLNQWIKNTKIRTVWSDGKSVVLEVFRLVKAKNLKNILCVVDLDFDGIMHDATNDPQLIYVSYGKLGSAPSPILEAIDLEALLIRSDALHKLMCIKGPSSSTLESVSALRENLRKISLVIGASRLIAMRMQDRQTRDLIPPRNFDLSKTTINFRTLEFDPKVLTREFFSQLSKSSINTTAENNSLALVAKYETSWALSRGHDLTAILAQYLTATTNRFVSIIETEQSLKMAFEKSMLEATIFGKICTEKLIFN